MKEKMKINEERIFVCGRFSNVKTRLRTSEESPWRSCFRVSQRTQLESQVSNLVR